MTDGGARPEAGAAQGNTWTITAGPFTRADRLRRFIAAVGGIAGVTELEAERFRRGQLALRLRYSGVQPLAGCLAALPEFHPQVAAEASGAIRLMFTEGQQDNNPQE